MNRKLYKTILPIALLTALLSSCSAEKKPLPPQGYMYCAYCHGTGYEYCYLGGLISDECDACGGSGYGLNPNSLSDSPTFRGNRHVHIDEHIPWNECDICGKHKVYW